MDQSLCKLTLVFPPGGSDRIVELMLTAEPPVRGFTTWSAEGHGHGFAKASVSERVRGRVNRTVLVAVLPRTQIAAVLEEIRTRAAIPHMTYWIEPVEGFGRLTTPDPAGTAATNPTPASPPEDRR